MKPIYGIFSNNRWATTLTLRDAIQIRNTDIGGAIRWMEYAVWVRQARQDMATFIALSQLVRPARD